MIRLVCLLIFCITAWGGDPAAEFEAANRLYEKNDFAGAIAAYKNIVATGRASAPILFNLGNACFKNGQVGLAIASYRQAHQLAPRDPDIRANLRFARGSVPGNTTRVTFMDRLFASVSLNEAGLLSLIFLWIWFGLLAAGQIRPTLKATFRSYVLAAGILGIAITAWFIAGILHRSSNRIAVVIAPTAAVRYGPLEESQISFNVRDGNELRVIGEKEKWLQVLDPSNRPGWIPATNVVEVP